MSEKQLIKIRVDGFLHNLHYVLGSFLDNQGDGHTWRFEAGKYKRVKSDITNSFTDELEALLDKAYNEYIENLPSPVARATEEK